MKKLSIDQNRLVRLYESGVSSTKLCEEFGISRSTVLNVVRRSNGTVKVKHWVLVKYRAVALYQSGLSENQVAQTIGCSRTVVRCALTKSGVYVRSQSEAETLKWQQMSADKRKRQVQSAHQAVKDKPRSFFKQISIKQAKTKEQTKSKVGFLEQEFALALELLGKKCLSQTAIDVYNADLTFGNTVIEIHANSSHPHNHTYYRRRIENILKLGWNVLYIKCTGKILIDRAAQKISLMIDLIESNQTACRHYGVIGGSGDLVASGCLDGDHLACVKAPDGFFAGLEGDESIT